MKCLFFLGFKIGEACTAKHILVYYYNGLLRFKVSRVLTYDLEYTRRTFSDMPDNNVIV